MHNGYGGDDEINHGDGAPDDAGMSGDFADIEEAVRANDEDDEDVRQYQQQNGAGDASQAPADDGEAFITEEDCWTVISAHFKERTLVNQQLDSFDVFLTNTMQVRRSSLLFLSRCDY